MDFLSKEINLRIKDDLVSAVTEVCWKILGAGISVTHRIEEVVKV